MNKFDTYLVTKLKIRGHHLYWKRTNKKLGSYAEVMGNKYTHTFLLNRYTALVFATKTSPTLETRLTASGDKVTFVTSSLDNKDYPWLGLLHLKNGLVHPIYYNNDGKAFGFDRGADLIPA